MSYIDPAYDEYLSTGIDPTGGEIEDDSCYTEEPSYSVWYFKIMKPNDRLIAIFKRNRVPYYFSEEQNFQPHQFVVRETASQPSAILDEIRQEDIDIFLIGHERTHRLVYERAFEDVFGEQPEA